MRFASLVRYGICTKGILDTQHGWEYNFLNRIHIINVIFHGSFKTTAISYRMFPSDFLKVNNITPADILSGKMVIIQIVRALIQQYR